MDFLNSIIGQINNILWSYVLIALLILSGLLYTIRTGFAQGRLLGDMVALITGKLSSLRDGEKKVAGQVTGFQAFCIAVASHVAVQVALDAGVQALDAFAAQAELFAVLRAFGDGNDGLAFERGHFGFAADGRRGEADGHDAVQVVAVALEDVVLFHAHFNVEVAGRAAVHAGFAVAGGAQAHAVVDAGGNLDFQRLVRFDLALAVAGGAGVFDQLAAAPAVRAGLLHAEKALAHLHDALAVAVRTGFGAGAGARAAAAAGVAFVPAGHADGFVFAGSGFFQGDFDGVVQVGATVDLPPAAPRAASHAGRAEDVAKNAAKGFGEVAAKAFRAAAHVRVHARVAVLVVGGAFLRVRQDFVGLFAFLELGFGGGFGVVALVAVRVVFD